MAGPYYVDGTLATGLNNGTSWENAWQGEAGLQTGLDTVAADEILYGRNDVTLTGTIDIDQHSGSAGSPIRVIGCAADGSEDGTPWKIDGNDAAAHCLAINAMDHWAVENLELTGSTGDVIDVTGNADFWRFQRVDLHDSGGNGIGGSGYLRHAVLALCRSYGHSSGSAFNRTAYGGRFVGCLAYDNGVYGILLNQYDEAALCAAWNNTNDNYVSVGTVASLLLCVGDGSGAVGMDLGGSLDLVAFCRLTNNTGVGLDVNGTGVDLFNAILGNGSATAGTLLHEDKGATTRITSGEAGYKDIANGLFELILGAAGFRREVDLGGGNTLRVCSGVPNSILPRIGRPC